ncbi:cell wall-binding repeat-containing protein [Herbiconiux liukaitaii]|uniref:cell wall-binding repeat-containing protein n=1 Tax=Herbiconiux liukaitaii TaxID=3342799 RepID=UPI0035BA80F2
MDTTDARGREPRRRGASIALVVALAASALVPIATASAASAAPVAPSSSAEPDALWESVDGVDTSSLGIVGSDGVRGYDLDLGAMSTALLGTDADASFHAFSTNPETTGPETRTLTIPNPDGVLVNFDVTESTVMEAELAAAHPEIRTFAGHASGDPSVTVRAGITPLGFSASVRSGDNSTEAWYVDPIDAGTMSTYASYGRSAQRDDMQLIEPEEGADLTVPEGLTPEARGVPSSSRTIRAAMMNDIDYAQYFGTGNVLAAKVTAMNRVAQIYNDDLGVRLLLVNDTDKLNFDTWDKAFGPSGPCGDDPCLPPWAFDDCNQNAIDGAAGVIQRLIGDANYDVGHLMMVGPANGLGTFASAGVDYWKGRGCSMLDQPVGDMWAVDYVAHELGHQFGAGHSFNNCSYEAWDTAVEPGSGSTVMGYAGICGNNNLQSNTDPYFSSTSIEQIQSHIYWVGATNESGNSVPVVTAPTSKTIPSRTPFSLTAVGSDTPGDVLTYSWEQRNTGDFKRNVFDANKVNGPLFRVFGKSADLDWGQAHSYYSGGQNSAGTAGTRVFPDMEQVLRGTTNAHTGGCDSGWSWFEQRDCYSEFLPTAAYEGNGVGGMDFRVTARDQRADGGAIATADVRIGVDREAGPLQFTSLGDPAESLTIGQTVDVTWAVNATDKPELAPMVRVSMSTDGGRTFPVVLLDSTTNDGSETVTLPLTATTKARFKIEAVDNYFFTVSAADLTVAEPDSPEAQALILRDKEELRTEQTTTDSLTDFDNGPVEAEKNVKYNKSGWGVWRGTQYRDGEWAADAFFQWDMKVDPDAPTNYLGVRYYGGDDGRTFDVYLNDAKLKTQRVSNAAGSDTFYVQYDEIPAAVLADIESRDSYKRDQNGAYVLDANGEKIPVVTVRFQGTGVSNVGGVFGLYTTTGYGTDADLSALQVDGGSLAPALVDGVYDYTVTVPHDATSMALDADPAVESGLIYVDGILIDDTISRTVALAAGSSPTIVLRSLAQDHTTEKGYRISIVRDTEPQPELEVDRIAGADRFDVSVNTSKAGWADGSDMVYVASGEVFPDALSAASAASVAGAPILLATSGSLPASVKAEIQRLGAADIVIVGGPKTISASVEAELAKLGTVTRIGGADRFEASRNIAKHAFPDGAEVAVLATGLNFPDALSAGAAVAGRGPVILVDGGATGLDSATKSLLADLGVDEVAVAGGTASVSAGIQTDAAVIAETVRLGGADRFAASRAINDHFVSSAKNVLLATGANFPDALSGSAFGPRRGAPLFTVQGTCIPAETLAQITSLGAEQITLLGGEATLSAAVENLVSCSP